MVLVPAGRDVAGAEEEAAVGVEEGGRDWLDGGGIEGGPLDDEAVPDAPWMVLNLQGKNYDFTMTFIMTK